MTATSNLGDAPARLKIIEDFTDDDFGIIRVPDGPRVEIAVAHDGTLEGVNEAERLSFAIAALPDCLSLLQTAVAVWQSQFDADEGQDHTVSGGDLVEWFAQWRLEARKVLMATTPPSRPEMAESTMPGEGA